MFTYLNFVKTIPNTTLYDISHEYSFNDFTVRIPDNDCYNMQTFIKNKYSDLLFISELYVV
jgi:hypothetical protein